MEGRFPRIWVPSEVEREQRQLLLPRHKLVRMRTQVKTELQLWLNNSDRSFEWALSHPAQAGD